MNASTRINTPRSLSPHSQRFRTWGNAVGLLLLAGYLIFCHGCHGADVDDELCIPPPVFQKSENRNPKSERNPNHEAENHKPTNRAVCDL